MLCFVDTVIQYDTDPLPFAGICRDPGPVTGVLVQVYRSSRVLSFNTPLRIVVTTTAPCLRQGAQAMDRVSLFQQSEAATAFVR